MGHALRQSGFGLVVLYCLLRLYEMLWAHTTYGFMLYIIILAALSYVAQRLILFRQQGLKLTLGEQGVGLVVALMLVSQVGQTAFFGSSVAPDGIDSASYTFTMMVNSLFFLLSGAAMSTRDLSYSLVRPVVILGIVLVILNNARGEDILFVDYGQIVADSGLEKLTHLNVAEFVVLLVFICYASVRRLRFVVFGFGVLALFMLSGRSSLYFSIVTVAALEVLQNGRRSVISIGIGAAVVAALFFLALNAGLLDYDNKFVQQVLFVDGLDEDQSYLERQYINDNAFRYLPGQFLFGNPKIIALEFESMGSYLHNLMSAWQFFGFPVFAGLVGLLVASCLRMRHALHRDSSPLVVFGSLMLIYTVISVIASKFVGFRLLWLSIGFWMLKPNLVVVRQSVTRRSRRRSRHRRGLVSKLRRWVGA